MEDATASGQQRLLAIDAYNVLFRSHYAFINRPLTNAAGENTSAVYGFARELLRAMQFVQPTHIAVAFDPPGGSFRREIYADYKGQRPPTPEGVKWGAGKAKELLTTLGLRYLEIPNYEADDAVGSLVERFASEQCHIYMLSEDKDYQQLLSPHSSILRSDRKGGLLVQHDSDLCQQYGIESPGQFIEILALMGDSADNVPGVPKIGEKTATNLISKYGSIKYIYGNIGSLPKGQAKNLLEYREQLARAVELVTIARNVDIPPELEHYAPGNLQEAAFEKLMAELGFERMRVELLNARRGKALGPTTAAKGENTPSPSHPAHKEEQTLKSTPHEYIVVKDDTAFSRMMGSLRAASHIALDTETTGLSVVEDRVIALTFSTELGKGYLLRFPLPSHWYSEVKALLEEPNRNLVGHNLKYDLQMLAQEAILPQGTLYDTMLMHYLLHPVAPSHGLDALAVDYLGYRPIPFAELFPTQKGDSVNWEGVPEDALRDYAVEDSDITLRLFHCLWPLIEKQGLKQLYLSVEAPLIPILGRMERVGVKVDPARLEKLAEGLTQELAQLEATIKSHSSTPNLNVNSPSQIGQFLFEELGLKGEVRKTKTGKYSTDERVLSRMEKLHPVVGEILKYRELQKLQSTYAGVLPELVHPRTGCIHAQFNQMVVSTGRLSSSRPNLQNIPTHSAQGNRIREGFISRFEKGVILSADYSQVELRILAHMSGDEHMQTAFLQGEDIHTATAARIFDIPPEKVDAEQRNFAKRVNFGVVYGISGYGLSQQLPLSVEEANQFINQYLSTYPGVSKYMERSISFARDNGYVQTLMGRRCWLKDIHSVNAAARGGAERNAINMPIQGTAADIMKMAMVEVARALTEKGLRSLMILQEHDELIFDCPPEEVDALAATVVPIMEGAMKLAVPLRVDVEVGPSWGNLHSYGKR